MLLTQRIVLNQLPFSATSVTHTSSSTDRHPHNVAHMPSPTHVTHTPSPTRRYPHTLLRDVNHLNSEWWMWSNMLMSGDWLNRNIWENHIRGFPIDICKHSPNSEHVLKDCAITYMLTCLLTCAAFYSFCSAKNDTNHGCISFIDVCQFFHHRIMRYSIQVNRIQCSVYSQTDRQTRDDS